MKNYTIELKDGSIYNVLKENSVEAIKHVCKEENVSLLEVLKINTKK